MSDPYDYEVPEDLQPKTREEMYCEEHELIYVQNAVGAFVCPFCQGDY